MHKQKLCKSRSLISITQKLKKQTVLYQIKFFQKRKCTFKPIFHCKAKPFALDPRVGLYPQRHNFALDIPTCWNLKTLKFGLPPTPNLKFVLPQMRSPNARQCNIRCVGSSGVGACIWHVHFRLFVSILFAFCSQRKRGFQEYGQNIIKIH